MSRGTRASGLIVLIANGQVHALASHHHLAHPAHPSPPSPATPQPLSTSSRPPLARTETGTTAFKRSPGTASKAATVDNGTSSDEDEDDKDNEDDEDNEDNELADKPSEPSSCFTDTLAAMVFPTWQTGFRNAARLLVDINGDPPINKFPGLDPPAESWYANFQIKKILTTNDHQVIYTPRYRDEPNLFNNARFYSMTEEWDKLSYKERKELKDDPTVYAQKFDPERPRLPFCLGPPSEPENAMVWLEVVEIFGEPPVAMNPWWVLRLGKAHDYYFGYMRMRWLRAQCKVRELIGICNMLDRKLRPLDFTIESLPSAHNYAGVQAEDLGDTLKDLFSRFGVPVPNRKMRMELIGPIPNMVASWEDENFPKVWVENERERLYSLHLANGGKKFNIRKHLVDPDAKSRKELRASKRVGRQARQLAVEKSFKAREELKQNDELQGEERLAAHRSK
ncbi:hypothetical protein CALCODRAFT_487343 [Calocera cornea HHB12733]|uniref:Uncharacterized protein n=1 Tax=Calocera cornea HHB12733 TaxID=1353952 RepID=A0A165D6Z6_9BASI|nr:hypothetical protein CALCODRAFT_487343 [Calocera cornea HHB12733]